MRIAVPTTGLTMNSQADGRFGRAKYFAIVETDTMEILTALNPACDSQGGAGILAAQVVIDNEVKAVVTSSLGQNAADVLKAAAVTVYQLDAESRTVQDVLERFNAGTLQEFADVHPGFHGGR